MRAGRAQGRVGRATPSRVSRTRPTAEVRQAGAGSGAGGCSHGLTQQTEPGGHFQLGVVDVDLLVRVFVLDDGHHGGVGAAAGGGGGGRGRGATSSGFHLGR